MFHRSRLPNTALPGQRAWRFESTPGSQPGRPERIETLLTERSRGHAMPRTNCLFALFAVASSACAQPQLLEVTLDVAACAEMRATIGDAGLEWVGLLDEGRVLVFGEPGDLATVADVASVSAMPWQSKLPKPLLATVESASPIEPGATVSFSVVPVQRDRASRVALARAARDMGASIERVASDALTMCITADAWCIRQLLERHDVMWAEFELAAQNDGEFVREFGGANYVEIVDGYTGAGVPVEVIDGGLRTTHNDFHSAPPQLLTENGHTLDHGTSSFGVLFGDGSSDSSARGLAPNAVAYFSSYNDVNDRDAHMAAFAAPPLNGAIQSNSWGAGISRRYGSVSAEMDDSVFRHGVAVFQSQSNLGSPDSRPEAWAKNVISVGGVHGFGTLSRDDDAWDGVASSGPALDGRVKPDLVLFNDGIWTAGSDSDTHHRAFTGTSAATPAVAGYAAIIHEMWRTGLLSQRILGWDNRPSFITMPSERPSVAMTRALLVNSADPYPFESPADDLGRYRQGWGTPDVRELRNRAASTRTHDEQHPLSGGESWAGVFEPEGDGAEFRITMAYTDPAGLPMAVSPTVNDLNLSVISPSGVVYRGNAGLIDGVWSTPWGEADPVNTIENVFVADPEPGNWTVRVHAARVVEDASPLTPEIDAPFAIVVSGAVQRTPPALIPVQDVGPTLRASVGERLRFRPSGFTPAGDGTATISSPDTDPVTVGMTLGADGTYSVDLPPMPCGVPHSVRFEAPSTFGIDAVFPTDPGSDGVAVLPITTTTSTPSPDAGWTAEQTGPLTSGAWQFGCPLGGGLKWDPATDSDGDGRCWLTDNRAGASDVSGGSAVLTTPDIGFFVGTEPRLELDLWLACDDAGRTGEDTLLVEASTNGGSTWTVLAEERSTFRWASRVYDLSSLTPDETIRFRFTVSDINEDSATEAAIDNLRVVANDCVGCLADFNGNGRVDLLDLSAFIDAYQNERPEADANGDGMVGLADLIMFIVDFENGCTG